MQQKALAETLAVNDPGDETARRYRYQWTWAAIACCMLLDVTQDCAEVFCEHHEDVLIKLRNGKYRGLQVKTRDSAQDPWKTNDEAVKSALSRFCSLERLYPGQFDSFRFLTNHQLFVAGNSRDLRHVLQQIRVASIVGDLPAVTLRYVRSVAGLAGCSDHVAFTALKKVDADDSLPKLADVETRLISTLTESWSRSAVLSYGSLNKASRRLVTECCRAASLAHQDVLPAYLPAAADPAASELSARIAGKRFDSSRLLGVLEEGLNDTHALDGDPSSLVEPGGGDRGLLQKKLEAGGFSAVSQNSAADLRDKADYLGFAWTRKKDMPVPNLLLIDSPTKNISDDENPELVRALYEEIYSLAVERDIQFLLIDSDFVEPGVQIADMSHRRMAGTKDAPSLISYYSGP